MAAQAAGDDTVNDQSVNESIENQESNKTSLGTNPPLKKSISRTSVTFFSSENASHVAKQRFEALKKEVLDQTKKGEDEVKGGTDDAIDEKKLTEAVLNYVRFLFIF